MISVENKTNRVVAIKIIDLEDADDEIEDVQQEITVLSQCDSRFVTTYYGAYLKVRQINCQVYFSHHIKCLTVCLCSLLFLGYIGTFE